MKRNNSALTNSVTSRGSRDARGTTLVLLVIFVLALFGFASLSLDVGNVTLQRKKLHEATDSAALASVVDWYKGKTPADVKTLAENFATTNGAQVAEILSVECGTWNNAAKQFTGPLSALPANSVPAVRVVGRRRVPTPFWKVLTFGAQGEMNPRVESIAVVAKAMAATGVLPWAGCEGFTPTKCATVTLQFKDGGETNACSSVGPLSGNFGQLTLPGGSGASWYKDNIVKGYPGVLRVGQCVNTDPGVSWGPTKQGIDDRIKGLPPYVCDADSGPPDNKRLALIPQTDSLDVSGKKQVCITGFYVISLDGYNSGKKTVTATVLEMFGGLEVDPSTPPTPVDLKGVALVR